MMGGYEKKPPGKNWHKGASVIKGKSCNQNAKLVIASGA